MDIIIILILLTILIILGVREEKNNNRNIEKIPLRINVNGIRGKSTITRFITSILNEAGYKTIGKTTGTSPRMIYAFDDGKEIEIFRRPSGVNINEQLAVIEECSKHDIDALVCECMAVSPDLQEVYQNKMIKANIGVIVNVLEDHLDVMGPSTDEIALAFTSTIPYNGKLIISGCDTDYIDYFTKIAEERNTEVFVSDEGEIPEDYLTKFDFLVFPNNVAVPLALAKALGIDKETALDAMLKANPDPGSVMMKNIKVDGKDSIFVNAFAANEPVSTLEILEVVNDLAYIEGFKNIPLVIFNARNDRGDRTEQFVEDCLPFLFDTYDLIAMGEMTLPIKKAIKKDKLPNVNKFYDMEYKPASDVKDKIYELMDNRLVFFIGNIHGEGEILLDEISEWYVGTRKPTISLSD